MQSATIDETPAWTHADDAHECLVCTELAPDLRVLPCDHRLCAACVVAHVETSRGRGTRLEDVACPFCRRPFASSRSLVWPSSPEDPFHGRDANDPAFGSEPKRSILSPDDLASVVREINIVIHRLDIRMRPPP